MPVFAMCHSAMKSLKKGSEPGANFKSIHRSIWFLWTFSDEIWDIEAGGDRRSSTPIHLFPAELTNRGNLSDNYGVHKLVSREKKRVWWKMWWKNLQPCHLDLWSRFASISRSTFIHPSLLLAPCIHLAVFSSPVDLGFDDKSKTFLLLLFQMSQNVWGDACDCV